MRRLLLFMLAGFLLALPAGAVAEQGPDDPATPLPSGPRVLVVALSEDTPPFSTAGRFGVRTGFDVDIALAVCARMNAQCRFVPMAADEMATSLRERRADIVLASDGRVGDLTEGILRSNAYVSLAARYVVPRGRIGDFREGDARYGAVYGTPYARFLEETHSKRAVTLYDRADEMWIDLALGRLDTVLSTAISSRNEFLSTPLGQSFMLDPRPVADEAVAARDASVVVRKSDQNLMTGINAAVSELLNSAEYEEILTRHLAGGLAHRPTPPPAVDSADGA